MLAIKEGTEAAVGGAVAGVVTGAAAAEVADHPFPAEPEWARQALQPGGEVLLPELIPPRILLLRLPPYPA